MTVGHGMNQLVTIKGLMNVKKIGFHDDLCICSVCRVDIETGEWAVQGRGSCYFHVECAYNLLNGALPKMKRAMRKKAVDIL